MKPIKLVAVKPLPTIKHFVVESNKAGNKKLLEAFHRFIRDAQLSGTGAVICSFDVLRY
jgi:hypothetical protein